MLALACANKRVRKVLDKDRVTKLILGGTVFDSVYEAALAANNVWKRPGCGSNLLCFVLIRSSMF
jgi:hypothetical protein